MSKDLTKWVTERLEEDNGLAVTGRTAEGCLNVESKDGYSFVVAVTGLKDVVKRSDVDSLFVSEMTPDLVINVPSKALWSGAAIDRIHAASAAFGTLGDVRRAASSGDAGSYRNKNMEFFINAMRQHTNVASVSYIYQSVFNVDRLTGSSLVVAVVEAYNLSAEDVRNARARFGAFNIVIKGSSYGSITHQAEEAARSIGAQALTFRELMGRLAR